MLSAREGPSHWSPILSVSHSPCTGLHVHWGSGDRNNGVTTTADGISLCALLADTTTYSTQRSEHFKPCRDKDLAYCLNDGECFVIETLTGSHKHCR